MAMGERHVPRLEPGPLGEGLCRDVQDATLTTGDDDVPSSGCRTPEWRSRVVTRHGHGEPVHYRAVDANRGIRNHGQRQPLVQAVTCLAPSSIRAAQVSAFTSPGCTMTG